MWYAFLCWFAQQFYLLCIFDTAELDLCVWGYLIHWPLRDVWKWFYMWVFFFANPFYESISSILPLKLVQGECCRTSLMISQHYFSDGLVQQAIAWGHVDRDVCHHYRQVSNISRTLVGNKIVDHSDVVGASPVGAAPITFSFST